jgi:predicted dehydrogenase
MMRAAIVGLGWWGKHIIRRMQGSEELQFVLAIDGNPAPAAFAQEHGILFDTALETALADPQIDAVILATPPAAHVQQVEAVAAAGKHVFCEKPLALNQVDAERAVAACRRAGVVLGIGHERRFEAGMTEIRHLVRSGALGTIMHVEANFSHDKLAAVAEGDWRASAKEAPSAGMTAMGIHLTDAFLELFGPVTEVYAVNTSRVAFKNNGDVVSAHMRFKGGATGYLSAILVTPLYLRFTVFGSEGWVELRPESHPDTPGPATLTTQYRDGRRDEVTYQWTDTVRTNLETFARAAQGKQTYPFLDSELVGNIAVLAAISRSAAVGHPVALSQ